MKVQVNIINLIKKISDKYAEIRGLEYKLSEWLDKNGIEFDPLDDLGCAYSYIADGFPNDFIEALKELKKREGESDEQRRI